MQPDEILADPALETRARDLSRELRCMVCQNQSIDDSDAPLARDLRLLVRERLKAGDSDGQVLDFLTARYGEFVLLKPRFGWDTALLWLAPAAVLLLGGLRPRAAAAPAQPERRRRRTSRRCRRRNGRACGTSRRARAVHNAARHKPLNFSHRSARSQDYQSLIPPPRLGKASRTPSSVQRGAARGADRSDFEDRSSMNPATPSQNAHSADAAACVAGHHRCRPRSRRFARDSTLSPYAPFAQAQNLSQQAQNVARPTGFADIVEKVKPAVISVRVKMRTESQQSLTDDELPFPKGSPMERSSSASARPTARRSRRRAAASSAARRAPASSSRPTAMP